jgi:restriction system protein
MAKIEKERLGTYLHTALQVLVDNGGQLASKDVFRQTELRLKLSEYEKERYEKTGYVRWESMTHFWSICLNKAGWLLKKKGVWYITPEGREALKLSSKEFISVANKKYSEWKKAQPASEDEISEAPEDSVTNQPFAYEQAIGSAREEIRNYINSMDPYQFQELVAALLRAMGYHTPFIAPKGPDGGVDILAYRDPFGTEIPRIKVQVKHREQKASVQEIRQLSGLLHKEGDAGFFVSSGGFTPDALAEIRGATRHMEKIDLDSFIDLWVDNYDKMAEEDRALLPLRRIAFLAPNE